jgi:two-component system chemotaxis sensor kinase CheA
MDDLLNEFIAETREMLEALSGAIVAWESAPADRARLDEIFRFVHTVKGNSGFFDLPRIKALSHAAEDALAQVRSGTRSADHGLASAVLAVIDRIGELVQDLETGDTLTSGDDSALISALAPNAAAAKVEGTAAATGAVRAAGRTVRLPVDLLDRMMSGVSDLVLARNELARRLREHDSADAAASFERVSACIADLRDSVTRTRMQRIDSLFAPLPRMVRDLAAETGKQVSLTIDGGDVELDREMIEMIRDPLTHIIRNAVDHGIETSERRRALGKSDSGLVAVCARQTGNQILIEIRDDGRGIDGERLVAKALSTGILDLDRANRLTAAQKTHLVFEPGLSTAAEVTALSGRGVGMDVVRANIERIGGVVDVQSRPDEGASFSLRVPLTLTIIPALIVAAGGQVFAIPRSAIEEIVRVRGAIRIERIGGARIANVRRRRLPVVSLRTMIGEEQPADEDGQNLILLKLAGGRIYALAVDEVRDHEELVVKPAAPAIIAAGLYGGTTLGDDGCPLLLLDPPGIAARAGLAIDRAESDEAPVTERRTARETQFLLFRTLAGGTRMVALAAVERVEEVKPDQIARTAGRMRVTLGDLILPLEGCDQAPAEPIKVLRLTDGTSEIGYAAAEIIDIIAAGTRAIPASAPGEIGGVTLVAGEQVETIDLHWLFADQLRHADAAPEPPICLLAGSDPFLENILRPLVEAAGYRPVRPGEAGADRAAIVLRAAEEETAGEFPAQARIVRIRSAAEPLGRDDDSVHRYDRQGIFGALAGVASRRRSKR